jgi:hypothetical protein
MQKDICIVHIEDEFPQMKPFPSKMRDYVEQYWNDQDGGDNFTTMKETKPEGRQDPEWVVYDIACPKGTKQVIRYIFIGPDKIPPAASEFIRGSAHFIIDVLRPRQTTLSLWATAEQSITSAKEHGGTPETITIFTACQGTDLQKLLSNHPGVRCISKANIPELNSLLSRIVVEGMA